MNFSFRTLLTLAIICSSIIVSRAAEENDAQAVLDKGIKAAGGAEKLGTIKAVQWKAKGTVSFDGNDSQFTNTVTIQGLENYRGDFEGDFGGNKVKAATVVSGDKGWFKFGDMGGSMDTNALANQKRVMYLQLIPITLVQLKGKEFKVDVAGSEQVAGKPATILKVTPQDGKDFKLFLDQESGLPVKLVAKVSGFMNDEFTQETTFSEYKDFQGIQKATKIASKRDGEKFLEEEITDFVTLDQIEPETFAQPK